MLSNFSHQRLLGASAFVVAVMAAGCWISLNLFARQETVNLSQLHSPDPSLRTPTSQVHPVSKDIQSCEASNHQDNTDPFA